MKAFKLLVSGAFVLALLTPIVIGQVAHAQTGGILQCIQEEPIETCDLGIKKEVSVNGGAYSDANTTGEAAQANVSNEITWRITLSRDGTSFDGFPSGTVIVGDNLPPGVTYVSSSTSDGSTYVESSDTWLFTLDGSTTYPVTLTINTTAVSTGLAQNIAFLSGYLCDPPSTFCEYSDSNNENDGDQAWVNISSVPVVLGESTPVVLAATGSGTTESLVAAGLIATTLLTLGYNRFTRKQAYYSPYARQRRN